MYGAAVERFNALPVAVQLRLAKEQGDKLHDGYSKYVEQGLAVDRPDDEGRAVTPLSFRDTATRLRSPCELRRAWSPPWRASAKAEAVGPESITTAAEYGFRVRGP
jgi:hypothetical protein